uniref:Uncharacterized protein n=1 Tax=Arundo donax TaxID=35708 RepID=A0A0A9AFR5_ARUDO
MSAPGAPLTRPPRCHMEPQSRSPFPKSSSINLPC